MKDKVRQQKSCAYVYSYAWNSVSQGLSQANQAVTQSVISQIFFYPSNESTGQMSHNSLLGVIKTLNFTWRPKQACRSSYRGTHVHPLSNFNGFFTALNILLMLLYLLAACGTAWEG